MCLLIDLSFGQPVWGDVARGLRPHLGEASLYVAIGILGATVMPHNLYLHSALVKTRDIGESTSQKRRALRTSFWNTLLALNLAFVVNAAILIVAASAFHSRGVRVAELQEAHALLAPLLGTTVASALFALGLLCAGQSASVTATMAGQFVMEGFVRLRMTAVMRRLFTRALAIVPAVTVLVIFGDASVLALLIATQVVLSLQLPFAIIPLLRFTANTQLMGPLVNKRVTTGAGWLVAALVQCERLAAHPHVCACRRAASDGYDRAGRVLSRTPRLLCAFAPQNFGTGCSSRGRATPVRGEHSALSSGPSVSPCTTIEKTTTQ